MPALVASAPGRVNLIGEHTDYNGGLCLPLALPQRTTVTLRPARRPGPEPVQRPGGRASGRASVEDRPDGWAAYVAGVVRRCATTGTTCPGFDASVDSEVPLGAGLSSSAALECSVAVGARRPARPRPRPTAASPTARRRVHPGRERLRRRARPAAWTRPWRCSRGRATPCCSTSPTAAPRRSSSRSTTPGWSLLVIDTRVSHALTDGCYGDRRTECADAAAALGVELPPGRRPGSRRGAGGRPVLRRRARHVVTENLRVLAAVGAIGDRRLGRARPTFSTRRTPRCATTSRSPAASSTWPSRPPARPVRSGARMTGGGFGGSAVALVARKAVGRVQADVTKAFADAGLEEPAYLVATPGDAARVESVPSSAG